MSTLYAAEIDHKGDHVTLTAGNPRQALAELAAWFDRMNVPSPDVLADDIYMMDPHHGDMFRGEWAYKTAHVAVTLTTHQHAEVK